MADESPQKKLKRLRDELIKSVDAIEVDEFFEPLPDIIRDRTRQGFGITQDGGAKKNLKKLAKSTVVGRELKDRKGKLSKDTAPPVSNLTETGQMLDSIVLKKIKNTKFEVVFEEKRDDGKQNSDLVKYNADKGRTFFGLSKSERRTLERNVTKKVNELFKKIFKK